MISDIQQPEGMWKVRVGRKSKVFTRWSRLEDAIRKHDGETIKIKELFVDVLIATPEGVFHIVNEKVSPHIAYRYQERWMRIDQSSGVVLWPHGEPYPEGWNITPREEMA